MSQSSIAARLMHDGVGPQVQRRIVPRCFRMLSTTPEAKPSSDQHGRDGERAAVDAFEPFEAGQPQALDGERACLSA